MTTNLKSLKVHLVYFDIKTGYYPGFHHGIASLIGVLKKNGYQVSLSHLTDPKNYHNIHREIKKIQPGIIGFSFTTNQKKYLREFLDKYQMPKKTIIIAGGVHSTLVKEGVFKEFPELNGVFVGEGESSFVQLCQKIIKKTNYFHTEGFIFKSGNKIIKNPVSPLIDINNLPFPDYSLFNYRKIISENGNSFYMMLSRGCPYSCFYCCNHVFREIYPNREKYLRFLSPVRAVALIKNNLALYPQTEKIIFSDDTFTVNHSWLKEFCSLYKREINLPYICNGRVETINQEALDFLKSSGCTSIEFGVESGSAWVRKNLLNRHHSNDLIRKVFHLVHQNGIKTFSYNIVGFPFETKEMALETLKLNLEIKPDFGKCFYFYPFPGTKLAEMTYNYDLLRDDFSKISGYLHAPSVKPIYMSYHDMENIFRSMQVFFYCRTVANRLHLSGLSENILIKLCIYFRNPMFSVVDPYNPNKKIISLRNFLRKWLIKYLR